MAERVSVSALRDRVKNAENARKKAAADDKVLTEPFHSWIEASPAAAFMLFGMARPHDQIDGFPDSIGIGSAKYGSRLAAVRTDGGVWRLQGTRSELEYVKNLGDRALQVLLESVGDKLGLHGRVGQAQLKNLVQVEPAKVLPMLLGLEEAVPRHVLNGILSMGDALNGFSSRGWAPVQAIVESMTEMFGVDDPIAEGNASPLHVAATSRSISSMDALIKAGANVDLVRGGLRPLDMAIRTNDPEAVEFLIQAGAALDGGTVPVVHAALSVKLAGGAERILNSLLKAGASVVERDEEGSLPSEYLRATMADMEVGAKDGIPASGYVLDRVKAMIARMEALEENAAAEAKRTRRKAKR